VKRKKEEKLKKGKEEKKGKKKKKGIFLNPVALIFFRPIREPLALRVRMSPI
jgi:hypothetical protein